MPTIMNLRKSKIWRLLNFIEFLGPLLYCIEWLSKKKRLWHRYFFVNIAKFLIAAFFIEHFWLLLLNFLQNLLKITVKKIISHYSFSQKFLRNYFLVSAASFLIIPLQGLHSFCLSLNMSKVYLEPVKHQNGDFCENS